MDNKVGKRRLILSIGDTHIRVHVTNLATEFECETIVLNNSYELTELEELDVRLMDDIFIIETNDDVAELMQSVYGLYEMTNARSTLRIIGILSNEQALSNRQVNFWLIDGHAALLILLMADDPHLYDSIKEIVRRGI